jgi:hypothetical protein
MSAMTVESRINDLVASARARLGRDPRDLDDLTHAEQFKLIDLVDQRDRSRRVAAITAAQRHVESLKRQSGAVVVDAAGRVLSGQLSAGRSKPKAAAIKPKADTTDDVWVLNSPQLRKVVERLSARHLRLPEDAALGWRYQALVKHFRALGEEGWPGLDALAAAIKSDLAADERANKALAALRRQRKAVEGNKR